VSALYLGSLLVGVVLGVLAMLLGIERPRPWIVPPGTGLFPSREAFLEGSRQISARIALPLIAAVATGFGLGGYIAHRFTAAGLLAQVLAGTITGVIVLALAIVVIAAWAVPSARRDVPDARYLLQGHFAVVTAPILSDLQGRILLHIDGAEHEYEALSLEGDPIPAGTEVVIERVDAGVAYVESWAQVEKRI
jgi:membrane protein implicated in regulation of membrane protease activity